MKAIGDTEKADALREVIGTVPSAPLTGEDVKAEGDSLAVILTAVLQSGTVTQDPENADPDASVRLAASLAEGLARHPSIGSDKIADAAAAYLEKDKNDPLVAAVRDELNAAAAKPVGESDFADTAVTAVAAINAMQVLEDEGAGSEQSVDAFETLLTTDGKTLSHLSSLLSRDLLLSFGLTEKTADKVITVFPKIADALGEKTYEEAEAHKEAEQINKMFAIASDASRRTTDKWGQVDELLDSYLSSDACRRIVKSLTADGADPLSLYGDMKEADRSALTAKIADKKTANPDKAEALNDLAAFFGIA